MKNAIMLLVLAAILTLSGGPGGVAVSNAATADDCNAIPPFVKASEPPMVMLVMGRNHKLYYEAYNDASDLNEDGLLDVGYDPGIDYYGYFDSYKCYKYASDKFTPYVFTDNKKCTGAGDWSGDFLNYLTMSRMDALRKVLYGGHRAENEDKANSTVLERVFIPQDAHSWGKEFAGEAQDGYKISDYADILNDPPPGTRHLFCSTTLTSASSPPLLRYMINNSHRIWEWVAKERPVCSDDLAEYGDVGHPDHPADHDEFDWTVTSFALEKYEYRGGGNVTELGEPYVDENGNKVWDSDEPYTDKNDNDEYDDDWERPHTPAPANMGVDGQIAGKGNPWGPHYEPYGYTKPDQENYLTIFTGELTIQNEGTYQFAVNGDDAVEFVITVAEHDSRVLGWYGPHGTCGNSAAEEKTCYDHYTFTDGSTSLELEAGTYQISFRHEEAGGGDRYYLFWKGPDSGDAWGLIPPAAFDKDGDDISDLTMRTYTLAPPAASEGIEDLHVKVDVCVDDLLEANCKPYTGADGSTSHKPAGLFQRHGESDQMLFGLISGSNVKNTSGGVLRKKMGSIQSEINPYTGQFLHNMDAADVTALNAATTTGVTYEGEGIIKTIDTFRIVGFNYSGKKYSDNCGWIASRPIKTGECRMWGNPIGEMMYEALRYFNGKESATSAYTYSESTDDGLALPKSDWDDPFDGRGPCAKPFMLVISDINPTFDSDELPGVHNSFATSPAFTGDLAGLSVDEMADLISDHEEDVSGPFFIGQKDAAYDGSCSVKDLDGLGGLRGLCPEEPTKQGSYYAASVAYFGRKTDLFPPAGDDADQYVNTYSVALASPLPRIEIPVGDKTITLVPFAKSVGGYGISSLRDEFQPTNAIVDFFVDTLDPDTPTYGKFRINYEDVEQGADHDMDAIVIYEYQVIKANGDAADNPADGVAVEITLTSEYAAGSIIQHCGYIISGTTTDGTYLEVRDKDTGEGSDPDYFLDTPPGDLCLENCAIGGDNKLVQDDGWSDNEAYVPPYIRTGDETYTGVYNAAIGPNQGADDTNWDDDKPLPLTAIRRFTPAASPAAPDPDNPDDDTGDALVDGAAELLKNPLWYAAKWGGFDELEGDDMTPGETREWDDDEDGVPDTYFYVVNPLKLEEQLNRSFADILRRTTSGTAASVISSTRSGEGSIYQSVFYPYYEDDDLNVVNWIGQLHSLFIDEGGNMREDTNGNFKLDVYIDRILGFEENPEGGIWIYLYVDANGDSYLSPGEKSSWDTRLNNLFEIKYLWNSSVWLNEMSDENVLSQREYRTDDEKRYIFTFVDQDGDGVPAGGEIVDFECDAVPSAADLKDTSKIFPYIHVSNTFNDAPGALRTLKSENPDLFNKFLQVQSKRVIDFIRGQDQPALEDDDALKVNEGDEQGWPVPAFRSRQIDYNNDGTLDTWRLGDVVHSSPTVASRPAEAYHLLYHDESYAEFYQRYEKRRSVVYMGANDGMLHAFNGGFYNSRDKGVYGTPCDDPCKSPTGTNCDPNECDLTIFDCTKCEDNAVPFKLGSELWAYIPYNLLPHLYWLTLPEYGENLHVYYMDLKPKIFDAKVLPDGTHYTDSDSKPNWGTFLVAGMRFGGCRIKADIDKTDGWVETDGDPTMSSAFVIMDVTDPEKPPILLAEINFPNMGFTTCYPAAIPIKENEETGLGGSTENEWFLIFGSGPADASGAAGAPPVLATSNVEGANSFQKGHLYILDLKKLAMSGTLSSINQAQVNTDGLHPFQILDSDDASFISRIVTADYDLDYSADASYFGTVSGTSVTPGGKLRRVIYDGGDEDADVTEPLNWIGDSVLLDLTSRNQAITAAPNVATDDDYYTWVYVGTGRYYTNADVKNTDTQTMYGVKEPADPPEENPEGEELVPKKTFVPVLLDQLYDVTGVKVDGDNKVTGATGVDTLEDLLDLMEGESGWKLDFERPGERNLGIAAVFAKGVIFTTYLPSENVCELEGESFIYALYYMTGTEAYGGGAIGLSIGKGMSKQVTIKPPPKNPPRQSDPTGADTPELSASEILVQKNNAEIFNVPLNLQGRTRSGLSQWRDQSVGEACLITTP